MIGSTTCEKHLGIQRSSDGKNRPTIEARITLARRTAYGLMGAGLHGLTGVSQSVCVKILNIYVYPRLIFGLSTEDMKLLEKTYRKYLRCCQHLPDTTAIPAIYLLWGALPIEGQIHIKVINFTVSMLRRSGSVERDLLLRQVAMKDIGSPSWVTYAQSLLMKYNLPTIMDLFGNPPKKPYWNKLVRDTVSSVWEGMLKDEARSRPMSSLSLLNIDGCKIGHVHRIWRLDGKGGLEVTKATTKAKLLVKRYPLYSCRVSGAQYKDLCPLCNSHSETLEHFLLHCDALDCVREPDLCNFISILNDPSLTGSPASLARILLDCSSANLCDPVADSLEALSRNLCFKLHRRRSLLMGVNNAKIMRHLKLRL